MGILIITHGSGQLGNRLIQFGNVLAFAIEYNHTLINLGFTDYQKLFKEFANSVIISYPLLPPTVFDEILSKHRFTIDERLRRTAIFLAKSPISKKVIFDYELPYLKIGNLSDTRIYDQVKNSPIILLRGLKFQHPKLVQKHIHKIRDYFIFNEDTLNINENHQLIHPLTIGLHIRQGDYKTWCKRKYYFTIEEYAFIIRHLVKSIKQEFIVKIYSNVHIDPCYFEDLPILFGSGSVIGDLQSMAKCDFIIGPSSSFSFWASFVGEVLLYFIQNKNDNPSFHEFKINTDPMYTY